MRYEVQIARKPTTVIVEAVGPVELLVILAWYRLGHPVAYRPALATDARPTDYFKPAPGVSR